MFYVSFWEFNFSFAFSIEPVAFLGFFVAFWATKDFKLLERQIPWYATARTLHKFWIVYFECPWLDIQCI